MKITHENAVEILGAPRSPNKHRREETLNLHPLGSRRSYEPDRWGTVEDVSLCGRWILLSREEVRADELPGLALLVST